MTDPRINESKTVDLIVAPSTHTNSGYIVRCYLDTGISEHATAFSKWSAALQWLTRNELADYRLRVQNTRTA